MILILLCLNSIPVLTKWVISALESVYKKRLIEYNFAALYLETKKNFKQILFIDFSTSDFKLFTGTNTITLNPDVYSIVREQVIQKLQDKSWQLSCRFLIFEHLTVIKVRDINLCQRFYFLFFL